MSDDTCAGYRQLDVAPTLAKIERLQSDRRYRDNKNLFFAEGIRNFIAAVEQKCSIETILYSERLLISPIARKLVRQLKRDGVPFARVTPEQFRQISQTERACGLAAIFRQRIERLDQIKPSQHICWTALSHIRSMGNLGTLVRTSAAIGAGGFILIGNNIDPFDPGVVRATMGAIFKQRIIRASPEQFHGWIKTHNLPLIGASPDGPVDYDEVSYPRPTILMLGSERAGLTLDQQMICQQIVRIPMRADIDSLNVAVAGSLLLYEVFRTRRK